MIVSIIIPVYGVAPFIDRCVRSLMEQTYRDIEYIFVDDASPDDSIDILKKTIESYPERKSATIILRHDRNKGLPAARNTGMDAASGEYVMHCDSDDFVEPEMVERMATEAVRSDADMVYCDWFLSDAGQERYMPQNSYESTDEIVKAMLCGGLKYNVWNKLTRRSIFSDNALRFPDGYAMGEDMTMILAAACCKKIVHADYALYHYRRGNSNAMTQNYSDRNLKELQHNAGMVEKFISDTRPNLVPYLHYFKLQLKFPFLLMNPAERGFRLWREWWPESNEYISSNNYMSRHSRWAQLSASRRWWLAVRIYRYILNMYQKKAYKI